MMIGCSGGNNSMDQYGYALDFFAKHKIQTCELVTGGGKSRVLLVPAYQGRVMTSTTGGVKAPGYGWINYGFIEKGEVNPSFNPFGGEERFWIGPEGGPFSYYFKKGAEQVYENWVVPSVIDTEAFDIESQDENQVTFVKETELCNASDNLFKIGIRRQVALVAESDLTALLGTELPAGVRTIAYKTENTLTNQGDVDWTPVTGLPSVWLLGTFNPTPTTTVFIPYNKDCQGKVVNDEYFGKVPADRLIAEDGMIYFKIDGEYRSKIGLPPGSAKDICGSYDSERHVLNILKYTVPAGNQRYVNGQWGPQDDPFCGDVINSYNDGPTETGYVQGPFYEIETSSPGAQLAPGESLTHTQYTIHIEGTEEQLAGIVKAVFGADLNRIATRFNADHE
ncbi:MAG: hypothetical protein IJS91_03975 [Bacteroidales bacterium]|nr:hypothetical protein [Bacteroidales bacterium]